MKNLFKNICKTFIVSCLLSTGTLLVAAEHSNNSLKWAELRAAKSKIGAIEKHLITTVTPSIKRVLEIVNQEIKLIQKYENEDCKSAANDIDGVDVKALPLYKSYEIPMYAMLIFQTAIERGYNDSKIIVEINKVRESCMNHKFQGTFPAYESTGFVIVKADELIKKYASDLLRAMRESGVYNPKNE